MFPLTPGSNKLEISLGLSMTQPLGLRRSCQGIPCVHKGRLQWVSSFRPTDAVCFVLGHDPSIAESTKDLAPTTSEFVDRERESVYRCVFLRVYMAHGYTDSGISGDAIYQAIACSRRPREKCMWQGWSMPVPVVFFLDQQ